MKDTHRPVFHFTPPSKWMNDPNGLVYFDGEYHLFYQYHPDSDVWGPMHWGHAVSTDLMHWEHLPIALYPDEHGMIFSGSAVVDVNNTAGFGENALVAAFTYNRDHKESQNIAYSTDRGRTWTKYAGNPVVSNSQNLRDFRDPKVFWHENCWVMILAAGNSVLFYRSLDLKRWEFSGSFGNSQYGSTNGVWETPDLFKLQIDSTTEARWVLMAGVSKGAPAGGSGTQYFIGDFNGETFISENPKETILWADYGADYYAPQAWNNEPNGRRILLAWMSNWEYAREVPSDGWRGIFTLPREVLLTKTDNGLRLKQTPAAEIQALRGEAFHFEKHNVQPGGNPLEGIQADTFELDAKVKVEPSTNLFGFRIRKGAGEYTTVGFNTSSREVFIDRRASGIINFNDGFAAIHTAPLDIKETVQLKIFVDRCSVEVFVNDGLTSLSDLIYPSMNGNGLEFFTEGGNVLLESLSVFQLNMSRQAYSLTKTRIQEM